MVDEQQHPSRSQAPESSLETAEWCVYCLGWLKDLCFILLFVVIIMQGHSMLKKQYKEADMTSVLISTQYEILKRLTPGDHGEDNDPVALPVGAMESADAFISSNAQGVEEEEEREEQGKDATSTTDFRPAKDPTCRSHRPCRSTNNPNLKKRKKK